VRLNQSVILPSYFAAFLRTSNAKEYFLRCSKQTTNLASINMTQLRATPVPVPPLHVQQAFANFLTHYERLKASLVEGLRQADHLFHTLLHQAFAIEPAARSAAAAA
jgi:type I restriction enzyme S subunit